MYCEFLIFLLVEKMRFNFFPELNVLISFIDFGNSSVFYSVFLVLSSCLDFVNVEDDLVLY